MIAIDTSALIAFFQEEEGRVVGLVESALEQRCAAFPPVVLSEMLSDHKLSPEVVSILNQIPHLPLLPGYWERVGLTRARILKKGLRARLADSLIAQCCIDGDVSLVTADSDFRHYAKYCGLKLL